MANSNKIFMWATLKSLIGIATEDNSVSSPNTKKVINYLLLAAVAVKNVAFLRNVSDYNPLRHRNNFNLKTWNLYSCTVHNIFGQTYEPVSISMDTSPDPPTPIKSPSQSQSQSQPGQQRSVGSLVLLTQKFVELMKANGGSIDLKAVRSGLTSKRSPLNQPFIYPSAGHQNLGRTEAPNIRHYQCSGGHWTNR